MISVCMIVKDEEENLKISLPSIIKYIKDIIVVDTGSKDNTKYVARQFTNKVFDYEWNNNFSDARNYSLKFAENDWILILDADEEIVEFDLKKVHSFISNNYENVGRIQILNDIANEDLSISKDYVSRLFRRDYYKYKGKIHEQLISIKNTNGKKIKLPIICKHVGYSSNSILKNKKIERNLKILKEAIIENPRDPYQYYQLGKTYFLDKNYEKAIDSFVKSIEYENNFYYEYTEDLIECYGYSLINSGKYIEAKDILGYEKYYKTTDFIFLKGLILMNNAEFQLAAEAFLECTSMGEGKLDGVNSYKAYYNIGIIFECLGLLEESKNFYLKCGNYDLAKQALKRIVN